VLVSGTVTIKNVALAVQRRKKQLREQALDGEP